MKTPPRRATIVLATFAWLLSSCESREEFDAGTRLVYQIQLGEVSGEPSRVETELARCVEKRLEGIRQRRFRVRIDSDSGEGSRLVVELPRNAPVAAIKPVVSRRGRLAFHLVARDDVERSASDVATLEQTYLAERRAWIARRREWLAGSPRTGPEPTPPSRPDYVTRKKADSGDDIVLHNQIGDFVDGRHLSSVSATVDSRGAPALAFELDRRGAAAFGTLTSANRGRSLAIVLDDRVLQVAVIESRIGSRGQITGRFTHQEITHLVAVLRGRPLPAALVLLEEVTF